jgi:CBS domain-containing protein
MITVGQFLEQNKRTVWSLNSQSTVKQALQLLADKNIGAVVVLDQDKLVGIFSERDYARKVILKGKNSIDTKLYEVMSEKLTTITPDLKIDECMQLMTNKFIRHLPVVDKEKCIGIVSIGDVVKIMIEEQKYLIEELKKYISS